MRIRQAQFVRTNLGTKLTSFLALGVVEGPHGKSYARGCMRVCMSGGGREGVKRRAQQKPIRV